MKSIEEILKNPYLKVYTAAPDGLCGAYKTRMGVVFSWGGGWEHLSVSYSNRCPTWQEMCELKDVFFRKDECCIQYHPAESEYVNCHPYCLHIWRPLQAQIPTPPIEFV